MKNNRYQALAIIFYGMCIAMLFPSCNQKIENDQHREVVEFSVDENLLSKGKFTYGHNAFCIQPPVNWDKVDSSIMISLKIEGLSGRRILGMYKNDTSQCALVISDLSGADSTWFRSVYANPAKYLNQDSIWTQIQPSYFFLKSYRISQYVLQNERAVLFKLFVKGKGILLELDYIIPRKNIQNNIRSVESSIGSMQ